ncbi:MAG: arginine deiminase, partial [Gemmatimonadetes bacterium]|nr:arginine deiminase [Gemmatimonadota bacterium]
MSTDTRSDTMPTPSLGVHSEVGALKRVLLHRPDLSLRRLTPANCRDLLFDDVLWVDRAREDHDRFREALEARGVEVLLLEDLLTHVLGGDEGRQWLIERRITEDDYGVFVDRLRTHLDGMNPRRLARYLIGGLTKEELEAELDTRGLLAATLDAAGFVLPPLPNHLFTRDTSCWIYGGVSINPMATAARWRETANLEAVYRFHPSFSEQRFQVWFGGELGAYESASLEGGDVLVVGNGVVLVGLSIRTTPQAVEILARALFRAGAARRVIAVDTPKRRATMHLDTVMTMIDRDAFSIFPQFRESARSWTIVPGDDDDVRVSADDDFIGSLTDALGLERLRLFTTGGDRYEVRREQWDDGNNVVAIEPGVVVAYSRNEHTNQMIRDAGVEVIEID